MERLLELFWGSYLPTVASDDLCEWIEVEENQNLHEVIQEGAFDVEQQEICDVMNLTEKDDNDGDTVPVSPVSSPPTVAEMFSNIEEICFNSNNPGVARFLRRAKRNIEFVRVRRGRKQTCQTLLTEL